MRYDYIRADGKTITLDTEERYSDVAASAPRDVVGEPGHVVLPAMPASSDDPQPLCEASSVGTAAGTKQAINTADRFSLDVVPYK